MAPLRTPYPREDDLDADDTFADDFLEEVELESRDGSDNGAGPPPAPADAGKDTGKWTRLRSMLARGWSNGGSRENPPPAPEERRKHLPRRLTLVKSRRNMRCDADDGLVMVWTQSQTLPALGCARQQDYDGAAPMGASISLSG